MCRIQAAGCQFDPVIALIRGEQRFGPAMQGLMTTLTPAQTARARSMDTDMPKQGDVSMSGHVAHRNRMSVNRRMFGTGTNQTGIRQGKVSHVRYLIGKGEFETPLRVNGAAHDMTRALQQGSNSVRTCQECQRPLVERDGGNFFCPNCGEAYPSM